MKIQTPQIGYLTYLCLFLFFSLSSCLSFDKLLEEGECERAYKILHQRLKIGQLGKDNRNLDYLNRAYTCLQTRDELIAQRMASLKDPSYYSSIADSYALLIARRKKSSNYLDNLPNQGFDSLHQQYARLAAEHLFSLAEPQIEAARNGDKAAARLAYKQLANAIYYDHLGWTPAENIQLEMQELGVTRIWVNMAANLEQYRYEPALEQVFAYIDRPFSFKHWTEVSWQEPNARVDYIVEAIIDRISVSANREDVNCKDYSEEVKVGEKEVEEKKQHGDSTWVEKKVVEIFEEVFATVCEVRQSKDASLYMHLQLIQGTEIVDEWPITAATCWSNDYDECSGDSRALPCCCFGSRESYPSDHSMKKDAARAMIWRINGHLLGRFAVK